ncbi:unnamed protein product [Cuscuta europaea]|uniref:GATA-type domain-containing protein n=1 Tax=Cuscuta europaea TaxID=41803 RepID=A0A9P0ZNK0_CUSEU|nr:unnamed protein product [Cuscuta europaea]
MVDLSDQGGSDSEEMNSAAQTPERLSPDTTSQIKTCADCGTTKTPLWRGGPAGPKSLCNACGIRSRKKRRALLAINKDDKKPKKSAAIKNADNQNSSNSSGTTSESCSGSSGCVKSRANQQALRPLQAGRKLLPFGREVALQRPRSSLQRRKYGEVERAAFVLMSLSCRSVFA